MKQWVSFFLGSFLIACTPAADIVSSGALDADDIRSGSAFLTEESRALQADTFANPGYLWVDRGAALFAEGADGAPSCESCHQDQLASAATRFPRLHRPTGALFNLESQINYCRAERQNKTPYPYESEALLSLATYIANQSLGQALTPVIEAPLEPYLRRGEAYFNTRRGQLNLSCAQCHTSNWGKKLRGDTISQGHSNGFPAYRYEWQSVGSLHRRLHDCDLGVRAEPHPLGSQVYRELELYLAVRGDGLVIESPAIRR